jgi:hypothetical protein
MFYIFSVYFDVKGLIYKYINKFQNLDKTYLKKSIDYKFKSTF